jgi:glutamine amidotransferase
MGNLRSVMNAFREIQVNAVIEANPERLSDYTGILLPGVGAFEEAISALRQRGMADSLDLQRRQGKSILGICLGMQLMCNSSQENGFHEGMGWIDAAVNPIPAVEVKIPHIGWNDLIITRQHDLVRGLPTSPDVYFVHSYRVECADPNDVIATCHYGEPFCAMFARDNLQGMQFHPEKSQQVGLKILSNFVGSLA